MPAIFPEYKTLRGNAFTLSSRGNRAFAREVLDNIKEGGKDISRIMIKGCRLFASVEKRAVDKKNILVAGERIKDVSSESVDSLRLDRVQTIISFRCF